MHFRLSKLIQIPTNEKDFWIYAQIDRSIELENFDTRQRQSVPFFLKLLLCSVPEEFENMRTAASRESERRAMIVEILTESFPIATLLILISTAGRGGCYSLLVVDAVV